MPWFPLFTLPFAISHKHKLTKLILICMIVYSSVNVWFHNNEHFNTIITKLDPPQQIQGGARGHTGYRNNPYCLSCQLESNPPPKCNWTIYSYSFPPSPFSCFWDRSTCAVVSNPPGGVSFPDSPEGECKDPIPLPDPVYPGCVIKIDRLTEQYQTDNIFIMCTAENSHGTNTVDFQFISFSSKLPGYFVSITS